MKSLLIGGQAAIVYGAIEFSRDCDCIVLAEPENLSRLRSALAELAADQVFVPPLEIDYLSRGHACHFRCQAPDVEGFRIDITARLRGVAPFAALWERRHTVTSTSPPVEIINLRDLVQSKKTQRDKDWVMLSRLIEADIVRDLGAPSTDQPAWWLKESRDPARLTQLVERFPREAETTVGQRPLLKWAMARDTPNLLSALKEEELNEREADRRYWEPLMEELRILRRRR